ncbi:Cof-type HAD-IIB family hydrolase [Olsenella profusa]|uniref:Cof-like hydrolase n=1 Tax=Olsenella profusa F0195 TaxID=1125712 RepID=U2TJ90_9ACTN|nr:Cof-type HAD-IIB family hydrolase [Olsenella profusa]ERL06550.1 Cof-like hydrolase [Olsenella profusa F0195]
MPHRPKLLALDMDGTLLTSTKQIAAQTSEALAALCATGVTIALSTGRGPAELNDFAGRLPWASLGSLCSGGLVYDLRAGRPLASTPIPDAEALACIGAGGREGAMVHLSTTTRSVTQTGFIEHCEDYAVGVYKPMFRRQWDCSDDLTAYVADHPNAVIKIDIYHPSPAARERTLAQLSADTSLALKRAETTSVECTARGVDKALGLMRLCGLLGIDRADVVAIGDDDNDLDALEVAGTAVAMGNANERVQAVCDLVVADNDHNGIVEAIEWLF